VIELRAERVLVDGWAEGEVVVLERPLSLWGGLDVASGEVVDPRHPQKGAVLSARVVALPVGRGSSSSSSILLETVRLGTAPAALLTLEPDPILALGALVAKELYARWPVVAVVGGEAWAALATGQWATISAGGGLALAPGRPLAEEPTA
jgi:predicted aconitase with swiveling domain